MEIFNKLTYKKFFTDKDALKTSVVGYKADCSAYQKVGASLYVDISELDSVKIDSDPKGSLVSTDADGSEYRVIRVQKNGVNATVKVSEDFFK